MLSKKLIAKKWSMATAWEPFQVGPIFSVKQVVQLFAMLIISRFNSAAYNRLVNECGQAYAIVQDVLDAETNRSLIFISVNKLAKNYKN